MSHYNIFRYRVVKNADRRVYRRQIIRTSSDEMETRYAVCIYQGHNFGYEDAEGNKYDSFRDAPYTTVESTARSRAWRRWGYSKLMDANNW